MQIGIAFWTSTFRANARLNYGPAGCALNLLFESHHARRARAFAIDWLRLRL
jgi:hypothetical protein